GWRRLSPKCATPCDQNASVMNACGAGEPIKSLSFWRSVTALSKTSTRYSRAPNQKACHERPQGSRDPPIGVHRQSYLSDASSVASGGISSIGDDRRCGECGIAVP